MISRYLMIFTIVSIWVSIIITIIIMFGGIFFF